MRLSREKILEAGLDILDSYGLADMTMRRLATHLGVAPGALYWHFANKQALIESIAREILAPVLQPMSEPTESGPAAWCTVLRSTLLVHRDGAELVSAALSMTSLYGELLDALATHLNIPGGDGRVGAATLLHFVMGSTVLAQSAQQAAESTGTDQAQLPAEEDFHRGLAIIGAGLSALQQD